jgi:hypothetical protein
MGVEYFVIDMLASFILWDSIENGVLGCGGLDGRFLDVVHRSSFGVHGAVRLIAKLFELLL